MAAVITSLLLLPATAAAQVDIAAAATSAPPPPSAPPASSPAPAANPAPAAAAPATPAPIVLRLGATGTAVRHLQRELRRRGLKVAVDGEFGPKTKRAVQRVQRRFGMTRTGVAGPPLLKRLGLFKKIRAASAKVAAPLAAAATPPAVVPGASPYLDLFPVVGENTYSDDFGAPRHQGAHEGVDIMAAKGTPLVAVAAGTVLRLSRVETGLAGLSVWLKRADGTEYFYAHMDTVADGLDAGSAVAVGQVIGTVGNTGDARYGAHHLHFEIHPGGGGPTDPYPHLMSVDPKRVQSR